MRILVLTALYPPLGFSGHEDRCKQTVEALLARGHRIQILTSNHRLPSIGLPGDSGIFRELDLYESDTGGGRPLRFSEILGHERANNATLIQKLDAFRPDVVYVWNMKQLSKSLLALLEEEGVPVVYDLHSAWLTDDFSSDPWVDWWTGSAGFGRRFKRATMRLSGSRRRLSSVAPIARPQELNLRHAFVCSQALMNTLSGSEFDLSQCEVLYPATGSSEITAKIAFGEPVKFLWAGQLGEHKDPVTAVKAVGLLRDEGLSVTLDVYGRGGPKARKALRTAIDRMGLKEQVHSKGIRPGELHGIYHAYDAILFTSRCNDPFPMTPIEAVHAQLPCILSRDGGIGEVLTEGESCLGFDPGDAAGLAAAIKRLRDLPDSGERLARSARESLHRHFSFTTYISKIEDRLGAAAKSA